MSKEIESIICVCLCFVVPAIIAETIAIIFWIKDPLANFLLLIIAIALWNLFLCYIANRRRGSQDG